MPTCADCSKNLPRLFMAVCSLCKSLDGKSDIEAAALREKPQCQSCGLVYSRLLTPLCAECVDHWAEQPALPSTLGRIPAIVAQVSALKNNVRSSSMAADILTTAEMHRTNASDTRLGAGITRAQNSNLVKAAQAAANANAKPQSSTTKTKTVLALAQAKRQGKIQLQATLWMSRHTKKGFMLVEDPRINQSQFYSATQNVESAFIDVVAKMKSLYEEHHPDRLDRLTRMNVTFHAHKNKSTYTALSMKEWGQFSLQELITRLHALEYVTEAQVKAGIVSIRVLVLEEVLIPPEDQTLGYLDSRLSSTPAQARVSQQPSTPGRKRKASTGAEVLAASQPAVRQSSAIFRPRQSAIRASAQIPGPTPTYTRNPLMAEYTFICVEFNELNQTFMTSERLDKSNDKILIADNWKVGCLSGDKTSGYLGSGSSKDVIYARYNGREYAFGQVKIGVTEAANEDTLKEEYKNLFDANGLANDFKNSLRASGMQFPAFYFNFDRTFIGQLVDPVDTEHVSLDTPTFKYFIASPLLPCGPADGAVIKYTGNDDVGPAPKDLMTALLHAYTHYTYVGTNRSLLICDIQGLCDKDKVLCLFDPQAHTDEPNHARRVYWDGGPSKMHRFIMHHIKQTGCAQNKFCRVLELVDSEESESSQT